MSRLKEQYQNEIVDALTKKFGYKNIMEVPKLDKIVINMGVGEAKDNAKVLDSAIADLEKISGYLKLLQDKGIPVLWRPLHEAAGNTYTQWHTGAWFWWGADGAQAYKDLWIYMFNWFRDAGIRNLIWVWTTQTSGPEDADFDFYPGDEYVDIIGKDIYNVSDASGIASQFTAVLQYSSHKMVTLSELGGIPDMGSCWDSGARWLYFMPW